jgi:6-phosphogluconolactonase (cycloisomerase 2 family)
MKNFKSKFLLSLLTVFSLFIVSCNNNSANDDSKDEHANHKSDSTGQQKAVGYIYTTTNGEGENQVVCLERYADGNLGNEKVYGTKGNGGSKSSDPVSGDYDYQGSVQIIDNYLLTTNTGSNSVSVFDLNKKDGTLKWKSNFDSKGQRPLSIGYTKVAGSETEYWITVANQWGIPTKLYEGDKFVRLPNDAFFKQDLAKPDTSDNLRNVQLYKFDTKTGAVTYVSLVDKYTRKWGGPAQVAFSPDGKKIAVTLWGIPHFLTEHPILKETEPSRVYVYDFDNGKISNPRYFEEAGLIGAVGFNWGNDNNTLYVSFFNVIDTKTDHGLVVLHDENKKLAKQSNHTTGATGDVDEACWTAMNPTKDMLYVVSFYSNVITPFKIENNKVVKTLPYEGVRKDNPANDMKDAYVAPDNKMLYCIGALNSYSIKHFHIMEDGSLKFHDEKVLDATKSALGKQGVYDLAGLAGFDVQ